MNINKFQDACLAFQSEAQMLVGLYSVVFINRIVLEVGNNILHVTRAKMQKDQFIRHDLQQKVSLSTEVFHTGNCCV